MATYKRISGDYIITTLNSDDSVLLNTLQTDISGNLNVAGNLTVAGLATFANTVISNVTVNAISTGSLVAGNAIVTNNLSVGKNIATGNIVGNILTAAQPNITSVGNLTSLNVVGNISGPNVVATSLTGTLLTNSQPNINTIGNLNQSQLDITGNLSVQSFYFGDGRYLSNVIANVGAATSITNALSNVAIPVANGAVYFTVDTTANVMTVDTTGITVDGLANVSGSIQIGGIANIAGDLNAIGNISTPRVVGNLKGTVYSSNNTALVDATTSRHYGTFVGNVMNITDINVLVDAVNSAISANNIQSLGNISAVGNIITLGRLIATGNVSGNYFIGNGSQLTGIDATSIQSGNSNVKVYPNAEVTVSSAGVANVVVITSTGIAGTLTTAAQPNITSVGTLTSLAVAGNITPGGISMSAGNAVIGNLYVSGNTTIAGNIQQISGNSGQFFGNASTGFNALYAGLPAGFSLVPQSVVNFITSFDGYSQVNLQNINAGNTSTSDYIVTSDEGDDTTHYVDLGIAGSTYNGTYAAGFNALGNSVQPGDGYLYVTGDLAQARIGNLVIGTPDAGSVTKIISGGSAIANISAQFFAPNVAATSATTGTFQVRGGIATSNTIWATGNITGNYILGNGSQLTGIDATSIQNGTANVRTFLNGNVTISASGTANVVVVTSTGLSVGTGNIGGGNINNNNANGVGNIGSATTYFNTVFAKATSAQYADVAEKYLADADYPVGTVLSFGGMYEVTASKNSHGSDVAGTISENPAYVMNGGLQGEFVATVALLGRVPCRVFGTIQKGDLIVASDTTGVATVLDPNCYRPGCVIGKALQAYNSNQEGVIEIAVGKV